jgi:hypothetical protein
MVAVAVDPGWGKDGGQTVQKLQGRKPEGGAARWIGRGKDVEDLVGASADEVQPFQREGRPCTVADQAFEAGTVGGLNPDAAIQTEASAVFPAEHVQGVVGLQEALAAKMPEDPGTDRMLEAFPEFMGEGCSFVEAEVGGWFATWVPGLWIQIGLDPLKEPVHHAQVEMVVWVQRRAETMQEAHGADGGRIWSGGAGLPEGGLKSPEQDVQHGRGGPGPVVQEGPQAFGDREHPLAHGHVREDVIHHVGGGLGHVAGSA